MRSTPSNLAQPSVVRELAIRVTPGAGEAFASYIERYAVALRATRVATLAALGLISGTRVAVVPPWYGVWLDPTASERFERATGLCATDLRRLLLSAYDGTALDFRSVASPPDAGYGARIGWAYIAGSQYCPLCLQEDGHRWRLAWKLPWSFACRKHRCLLLTHCHACGRRAMTGRARSEGTPAYLARVPVLGACAAHQGNTSYPGRGAEPCGAQFSLAPTMATDDPAVLDAQEFLDNALAGRPVKCLGAATSTLDLFGDLRALVATTLLLEDGISAERGERAPDGSRRASRYFTGVPTDTGRLASVLPVALEVLRSETMERAAELLAPVAESALSASGALPLPSGFRISDRVRRLLELAADQRFAMNPRQTADRAGSEQPLEPRHIPQLLWEEAFDGWFAELIPNVRYDKARLFCSLALVKWVFSTSWPRAAELLELPTTKTAKIGYGLMGRIADAGTSASFGLALRTLARALGDSALRIDYAERRRAFAGLDSIDAVGWQDAVGNVRMSHARSQAAVAWLWSHITGCSHRQAPVWRGEWTQTRRVVYTRFLQSLPTLRPLLFAYQQASLNVPTNENLISVLRLDSVGGGNGSD